MARQVGILLTGLLALLAQGSGAMAQTAPVVDQKFDPCRVIYEEIIPLRIPNFDQAAMWKKTEGVKGQDRPYALLPVVDGGQIMIGESIPYDEKKGFEKPQIEFLRTSKTGKILLSSWVPAKDLKKVADAILLKDRVVVLSQNGDDKNDRIELTYLNGAGEMKEQKSISDSARRLIPKSITTLAGGNTMVIAAQSVNPKDATDAMTVLYWVTKEGVIVDHKDFLPGVMTQPEFVGRIGSDRIVVAGRVKLASGSWAGWIMLLNVKGDLLYQQRYAKGDDSAFRRAIKSEDGGIVVIGDSLPIASGNKAAWVMKLDAEGNPLWQKFVTGTYGYSGLDVVQFDDGRYNILLAGQPTDEGGRAHARVITLASHGRVIGDEAFIEGANAIPFRLINQDGNRTLLGMAETGFGEKTSDDKLKFVTYDTWVLGVGPLQATEDKCATAEKRTLDDLP